jgi:hypothetical protein
MDHMSVLKSEMPVPEWWRSSCEQAAEIVGEAKAGSAGCLTASPGGRAVHCVEYGGRDPGRMGTANFNSAVAAQRPEAYCVRGKGSGRRPVVVVLAGIHGQEVEGVVAALSLVRIMETGSDIMGAARPALAEKLAGIRLIVVPLANPDGRARVPYMGWAGLPGEEMTKWGQGTKRSGEPYGWPGCKAVHPMRGDVGILGGYFDDGGVNIMHDEWSAPMSRTTRAILELASREGPDLLINLHSHCFHPSILPENYVPAANKEFTGRFAAECYRRMRNAGYETGPVPAPGGEDSDGTHPPPFNLNSMLHHVGCGACLLYESPHGCTGYVKPYRYEEILELHHILFDCALDFMDA